MKSEQFMIMVDVIGTKLHGEVFDDGKVLLQLYTHQAVFKEAIACMNEQVEDAIKQARKSLEREKAAAQKSDSGLKSEEGLPAGKEVSYLVPTIGRIVHYKDEAGETFAAIITGVHNATAVSLCVFTPTKHQFVLTVGQGNKPGEWNWPPRV